MTRIVDKTGGVVHFRNPADILMTLCGDRATVEEDGYLGGLVARKPMTETSDPVTCPNCAKVYCAVKNEPWNAVDDAAMDKGIYWAVENDGKVNEK